jgi:hypothetical protein
MATQEDYVKRKRKKRIAWIFTVTGFIGCTIIAVMAFLGKQSGQFTIQLGTGKTQLTMSTNPTFGGGSGSSDASGSGNAGTTYLAATGLDSSTVNTAGALPNDDLIDNSDGGSHNRSDPATGTYFAYTFFLKNDSTDFVSYSVSMSIDDYKNPENEATSLLDIMRVRLYENLHTSSTSYTHAETTYAMQSTIEWKMADGSLIEGAEKTQKEPIARYGTDKVTIDGLADFSANDREENKGFADPFASNVLVFDRMHTNLPIGAIVRYTVVMWLEGYDVNCKGHQPKNASITLSMHFNVLSTEKPSTASSK